MDTMLDKDAAALFAVPEPMACRQAFIGGVVLKVPVEQVAEHPEVPLYQLFLTIQRDGYAQLLIASKDYDAAESVLQESLDAAAELPDSFNDRTHQRVARNLLVQQQRKLQLLQQRATKPAPREDA